MPMKEKEILDVILDLASSTYIYGRLYRDLIELKEADPDNYAKLMQGWEAEEFEKPLDLILFLEEGKHCKRTFYSIPVTWEVYGRVVVEASSKEEALKKFHEIEDNDEGGFELPQEQHYVDGSFRLSDDDEEELLEMIEKV